MMTNAMDLTGINLLDPGQKDRDRMEQKASRLYNITESLEGQIEDLTDMIYYGEDAGEDMSREKRRLANVKVKAERMGRLWEGYCEFV